MKIKKEERKRRRNKKYKTLIKNSFKKIYKFVSENKLGSGNSDEKNFYYIFRDAQRIVDKSAQKGVIHKKNSSRKVGRIFRILNSYKIN